MKRILFALAAASLFIAQTQVPKKGQVAPTNTGYDVRDRQGGTDWTKEVSEQDLAALDRALSQSQSRDTTSYKGRTYFDVPNETKFGDLTILPPSTERRAQKDAIDIAVGTSGGRTIYVQARPGPGWPTNFDDPQVAATIKQIRAGFLKRNPWIEQCAAGPCKNYCTKKGKRQCCDVGC